MSATLEDTEERTTTVKYWLTRIAAVVVPTAVLVTVLSYVDFNRLEPPRPLPTGAITGTVSCNGKPVTSGSVVLWTAKGITTYALIQPDGKYLLEYVPRGRARLTVSSRTYAPDELIPRPDQPWPGGLPTSGDLPASIRPIKGIEWDIPEPLPRPTPEMKALLDKIDAKYRVPLTTDGFFLDMASDTSNFDLILSIP